MLLLKYMSEKHSDFLLRRDIAVFITGPLNFIFFNEIFSLHDELKKYYL